MGPLEGSYLPSLWTGNRGNEAYLGIWCCRSKSDFCQPLSSFPGSVCEMGEVEMKKRGLPAETSSEISHEDSPKILTSDFLSELQINDLLNENIHGVQKKLEGFLNFQKLPTSLKEAILLDYYTAGFWWAKGKNFSVPQLSKFMALLDKLLHNLQTLHASLEDSIKFLGEVMAEIGPNTIEKPYMNVFNVQQANEIIDYLKMSLFQHYKLYEFLFFSPRDEIVIGTELFREPCSPQQAGRPFLGKQGSP
uniref:Uncharacterized protein C10orf107 homolog isoform X3 n=1 Tax=Phascolarctos cinereus TaxID=38626 RepID=A0A6P5LB02_PHACI|nr:uncharacterized protein C10orf107 homolog isoform X3 [Phascolarctos cinereus]